MAIPPSRYPHERPSGQRDLPRAIRPVCLRLSDKPIRNRVDAVRGQLAASPSDQITATRCIRGRRSRLRADRSGGHLSTCFAFRRCSCRRDRRRRGSRGAHLVSKAGELKQASFTLRPTPGPHLIIARLYEHLEPMDRGERYEDPLHTVLERAGLGRVTGGGSHRAECSRRCSSWQVSLATRPANAAPLVAARDDRVRSSGYGKSRSASSKASTSSAASLAVNGIGGRIFTTL